MTQMYVRPSASSRIQISILFTYLFTWVHSPILLLLLPPLLLLLLLLLGLRSRYSDFLLAGWYAGRIPVGGRNFPPPSRPALGTTQPPVRWVPGLFPGSKEAEAWC